METNNSYELALSTYFTKVKAAHNFPLRMLRREQHAKIYFIDSKGRHIVHSFVDAVSGDILKGSDWIGSAKSLRGNIYQDKVPILPEDFQKTLLNKIRFLPNKYYHALFIYMSKVKDVYGYNLHMINGKIYDKICYIDSTGKKNSYCFINPVNGDIHNAMRLSKVEESPAGNIYHVDLPLFNKETPEKIIRVLPSGYELSLSTYLAKLKEVHDYDFSLSRGKRLDRIYYVNSDGIRIAHCFINQANGDILKAMSWGQPRKIPRGNIYHQTVPLLRNDFLKRPSDSLKIYPNMSNILPATAKKHPNSKRILNSKKANS